MSEREGRFIVVEGSDSSGKELQSRRLSKELSKRGYNVRLLDFPRYDKFFGSLVGRYLRGDFGDVYEVHPTLASFPYALDRFEAKDEIIQWKENGDLVVSNRFTGSNLAFMSAKLPEEEREDFIEWMEELEYERLGIPRVDLAVFLHVPAKIGQRLTMKKDEKSYMKGKGRGDIHERDLGYLETVVQQYLWLTRERDNWVEVVCIGEDEELLSPEAIHKKVMFTLEDEGII